MNAQMNDKLTPLHIAAKCGRKDNCFHLLEESQKELKIRHITNSLTPVGYALENGDLDTVKLLLEYGAAKGGQVGLDRMPPICLATS